MPLTLMTKLLDLLSRQMLTAVQASLDTFSLITGGTGGDLKTEEHFILSLNNFECRARSMDKVVGILKDLKVMTTNPVIKSRVIEVISGMAELQRFNVCGWYCLDYYTLLTLANTVVTYIVVLLQVGGLSSTTGDTIIYINDTIPME
ncbi:hypothetical protein Pmani_024471 [Petrolisthes manimaculis]|uniref:Uncharacterized protein n=1 Tax=Petrolisthes manimaculis TaxID=1843537 RepID=A0AAE1U264_9EUCA|nr:hypothetical protein Pmani_024471 [Petrolisthes manimaculis]